MLRKSFILKIFDAFSIQRWNDKIRPFELVEMDKNAHKMVIAYCIAKYEEENGNKVNWNNIIEGGIYELLRRVVISDIKSPVYRRIRSKHKDAYRILNKWVYKQLTPYIDDINFKKKLENYLIVNEVLDPLSNRILTAAHIYASYWEFQILRQANPMGYQINMIDKLMMNDIEKHLDLVGMRKIVSKNKVSDFIDLVGQLRFQTRWSHTPRIPSTSVLGHSMFVACLTYLFSLDIKACKRRTRNNFFGGLFHDLPEAVTRDIISPVKGSAKELSDAIGKIEVEMVKSEIYPLIEKSWEKEFAYFTRNEFKSKIFINGKMKYLNSDLINKKYNSNKYNPLDGELIEIADKLGALVEAYKAIESGIHTPQLREGKQALLGKYKGKYVGGVNIGAIIAEFSA